MTGPEPADALVAAAPEPVDALVAAAPELADATRHRVVLGVSGGIAAYKACELLRRLTEAGHDVTVVPTDAALQFVGEATWSALSGKPARTRVWDDVHRVPHVRLGQQADLVVVAPATADLMAKAAHGLADDLLTSTLLTARCPVVLAPAMHTEMWEHPATVANVATLRSRGVIVLDPASGRLTGADTGPGRLPDPEAIALACEQILGRPADRADDLRGLRVLVSAGGTREPIDPVRFIGNRSSGRQGYALAATAAARGASVTLVSANVSLADPAGCEIVRVSTAAQMRDVVLDRASEHDVVVMAAAVADFRPHEVRDHKIKKDSESTSPADSAEANVRASGSAGRGAAEANVQASGSAGRGAAEANVQARERSGAPTKPATHTLTLVRTDDVLSMAVAARADGQTIVGFAAETGDGDGSALDHGRRKLARKAVDLLVVNDVSGDRVFGSDSNEVVILGSDGAEMHVPQSDKHRVGNAVWDAVLRARAVQPAR